MTRGTLGALTAGAVLTAAGWPFVAATARTGVDASWQIGLHLAMRDGLAFGRDVVYTYGPLGFLASPVPFLGPTSAIATIATGTTYLAVVVSIIHVARRVVPTWVAIAAAFVVARMFGDLRPFEAILALTMIWSFEILSGRRQLGTFPLALGMGVILGAVSLGKLNVAVFVTAIAIVVHVATHGSSWRHGSFVAITAGVTAAALWLLTGQPLETFPSYLTGSIEIIRGYSEAMGVDRDPMAWMVVAFALAVAGIGALAWTASADFMRKRRVAILLVLAILGFALFKTAFVRGYPAEAFVTLFLGVIAIGSFRPPRLATIAVGALILASYAGAAARPAQAVLGVPASARAVIAQARATLDFSRWDAVAARTEMELRRRYDVPADIVATLAGRTVHIDPWETAVAAGYPEFRWSPLPVFQAFSAYTSTLDDLNADRLAAVDAPEYILREYRSVVGDANVPLVVDKRFRWWESPRASLETFCRYRAFISGPRWQALERTDASCGAAQPLSSATVPLGTDVLIPSDPRPDRFVIVRISGLADGVIGRIRDAIYRSPVWYASLDAVRYRLVPGTAGQGLVVAVPRALDAPEPFAFGPPPRMIRVDIGRPETGSDRSVTLEFLSVPWVPEPAPIGRSGAPVAPRRA